MISPTLDTPVCPNCGCVATRRKGSARGVHKYLCPQCGHFFTDRPRKSKPGNIKAMAISLYAYGVSLTGIAKILDVSLTSVHTWVRKFCGNDADNASCASLVTIPVSQLESMLPENVRKCEKPLVLVPVDQASGEVEGMVLLGDNFADYRESGKKRQTTAHKPGAAEDIRALAREGERI